MENDFLKPLNDYLKSYKTEQENGEIFRVRRDENGKIIDKVRAYGNNNRPLDLLPAEEKPVSIWDVKRKIPFTTALADPDEAEYGLLTQTLEVPKERFFGLKKLDVKTGDIINSGMAEVFKFPSVKLLAGPKEVKETALNGEAQRTAAALKAGANWSMHALKKVFEGVTVLGDSVIEALAKPAPEDYEFMPQKAKDIWESGLKEEAEKRNRETAFALKQFEEFANDIIKKTGTELDFAKATPDQALVYEGTQAAMSFLGAIGATVLAKNPQAGAALFGVMQLGDTTVEGLKAGLSYKKAKTAGFTDAAWINATERIGLKTYLKAIKANNLIAKSAQRIMDKVPKSLLARMGAVTAAGAFTEGAQEYIQDTGTDLIKNAYGVQNEKLGDILQKNIMSFVWGAVMGGGFGAAFNGASVLKTMGQVQSDLQKAGLPEEQARALAEQTAGEILSEDFVRDLTGPLIKEMSPMTYPDFDKNKVSQNLEAAIAEQKDRTKQLIDISAGYEEALRKNGAKEEEAQAAGRILANIVDNIAKKNKVLPKTAESFLNFKIERQAEDLPPAAQESYAQAAMYKTPHKDFEDFYNAAQNNKGKKQSYYTFATQGGTNIDIPSDSLLHDKKHPEMNPEEWKRVLTNIENIEEGLALKSKQGSKYKGIPLLLKVKGKDATYGVALELLDNGRILLTTAFKGTGKKGVDAWLKQVKNAGTPDTLVFDFRLTTDNSRRAATSGHSSFYSLSDIVGTVKAEDLPPAAQESYSQAAMYKNPRTDIKEFVDFVLSGQERKKSYFSFETKSGELWRIPGDTVIHDKKRHPDINKKDWEVLLNNFNKSKFYYPKNPQPVFAGTPYYGTFEHNGQNYGFIFEILESGERQVSSLFKNTKNGIEAFIKEKAANALEPLLQSSQLAFNKESGADFVGRPKDSITNEAEDFNSYTPQGEKTSFNQEEIQGFKDKIKGLISAGKSEVKREDLGPVSQELAAAAQKNGVDIAGYRHNIENSAVTHIIKKHGNKAQEEKRGQIAVTEEDLLNIPEIINNPDYTAFGAKDANGKDLIVYCKNMPDGSTFYIEEVRTGKKTLSTKSMRKYKGEADPSSIAKRIGNAHDTSLSSISVEDKNSIVKRQAQGRRGSIDLSKKGNVYYALVKIMQTGDKSTLLHELGHLWLYTAQDICAEDEFKETKKDLDEWLGKPQVKDGRYVYTRAQQEKLAQGLETYLMEGKAPAPALKSVFEKIRQWFMDIYNGALVEMSEAGRAVYDRMFELSGRDVEEHLKLYQDEVKNKKTRKAIKQLREEGKTDVEGLTLQDIEEYLSVLDMGAPPLPKATLRTYLRKYGANYAGAGRVDAEAYKNARIPNRKEGIGDDLARRLIDWGFLDGDINTYEDLNRLNQEAAEMIERALNGEDVYRLEDLPAVEQFEVYMEAAKTAEDALGGKIEEYRRVKDIIKGLRLEGYRPVSAKDIDFVAAQIEELETSAREEAEDALNPKIEKARKEAEAWKNTADKRQEDLHKAKAEQKRAQEEASAAINQKRAEADRRAQSFKKAVISEINKREIENKEALLKELKEAKEAKDILDAAGILLEKLEAEYAKTEEGKAERRKLDAPATDWGAKKAGVLKEINALMQNAEEKTRQAQAVLEEESRAKLGYRAALTEEEKAAANRAKAFLKENFSPRLTAVLQKALSGEEHLSPANVNRMIAHTAGTVSHFKKSLNQQINGLMAWAEKTQKENYNRYIWRKIDTELKRKAFEKSGNVKKAKLSQRAFDFLQKAREYWGLKAPEFTLENFKKPLRAEDITEIHNQVTGEAIPLIDHVKGRETEKVKPIEISQHRSWTNTKEDEKILSNIVFKDGKALVLESKNGKKYALSKSSLGKMYNTSFGRNNETFALKKSIIADIENVFPQMELVISHKEAKYNIDRNIERFAAVVKDKNENLFNVMAVAKNGKVAEVLINNLYDLQIEGKKVAEGPSGAYPGHLPHIDNLGDLRDFVKRKIAKYNKNYAGQKVIPARDTAFKPLLNGDNDIIAEKSNTFNTRTKPYSPEELQVILNARQDKAMAAVQNGDIYPVEEALLNGVLEFLVNGKQNNPADSQKLFEDVSALLKAGRANKLRENLRKQLSREYLREALNQALRNRKLPFGAKWFLNLPDTNYKQFLLNAFGVIEHEEVNEYGELVKTKTNLADALDTLQGQRGTALYKYEKGQQLNDIFRNVLNIKSNGAVLNKIAELQKTVFTAENYMRALNEADGAEQARILQDGKWLAEQDIDQDDLNKLEIMSVYEWYKNTQPETREDGSIVDYGLRGRLLRQYGQNQLEQMFNLLTPAEKRLADVLQQFTAAQWARENAVFREMHGFSLPQDPNYLPSVARRMDIGGDTDYIKQYISASANPSFIKKRVKSFRVAMKPTSILEIVQNHTNRAAEYINEALTFNLIKGVFKSEKIERAFESAAGREDGKKLYDKLLRLIDLQGPQIKKSAGSSPVMEFIFNGWVKSAMALKATVGAKQFATGISFAEKMPFHVWAKYFLEGMAKPKATYDFMLKNVPHIEVRFAQGSINESLQRAMAARDLNLLQTRWNNLTNALMCNIRWGDKFSFVYGGYPYYKYLTEDLKLSPQEARAKVEEQGESTLQSSQKALLGEYQANADNYVARIYTVFRNQSKQYFGKLATSYIQYKNGEISAADFGKTWLLYAALNPMIYTLLGFGWLYPGKDDDGEEKAQKGVFDVLASPITGLASVNAFAEAGVKYLLDAVYAKSKNQKLPAPGSVAMPAFEDIQRDVNKAVKAYNDAGGIEELLGEMSLTDSINSLAALLKYTGLPAQTALNAAGGVKDVFDGKTAKGLLRAAGYTEYRAGQMTGEKKKKTKKRRKKQRRNN